MNMRYGAVDLSGRSAALAVADGDGRLLLEADQPMHGRESARLAGWIAAELAGIGLDIPQITHWTVGSGPGSFTGMRLAAALVTGWSSRLPVRTRCVPSALAPAADCGAADGNSIAVLYDGRNRELLAFEVKRDGGDWRPTGFSAVWDADAARAALAGGRFTRFCVLADDLPALEKLAGEAAKRVTVVPKLRARHLLAAREPDFDNDLTRLVYIRPAVFPPEAK